MKEAWYCIREIGTGEHAGRLLVPWGDPMVYEYPIDYVWKTADEARAFLQEQVDDGNIDIEEIRGWAIALETIETVSPAIEGLVLPGEGL